MALLVMTYIVTAYIVMAYIGDAFYQRFPSLSVTEMPWDASLITWKLVTTCPELHTQMCASMVGAGQADRRHPASPPASSHLA